MKMNLRQRRFPPPQTTHYEDRIITRRGCRVSVEWIERNPLFLAVSNDDLETLKNLMKSDELSVNIQNSRGHSLLNFVIQRKRVDIFDFLLSLEQTDTNYEDQIYGTPLLCMAANFHEEFALKLIEKGADVHRTDNRGNTFLHIAAQKKNFNYLSVIKIIVEKGIDINHQNSSRNTPLHEACRYRNFDCIYMLLYYGADARIHCDNGELPLTRFTARSSNEPDVQVLEEILLNHTFDVGDSVALKVVLAAMCHQLPSSFSKMLEYIEHVIYDEEDLEDMADKLIYVKSENFKLFFGKFFHVVGELVENYFFFDSTINKLHWRYHYSRDEEAKEIFETVLRSECVEDFVQSSSSDSIISIFVGLYTDEELTRLTETVCLMLSYGLRVTSADLDAVYDLYGFCELFKILLHMDVETDKFLEGANHRHLMAAIFYRPQMTIENILEDVMLYPDLLLYFNHPKLKEYLIVSQTPSVKNSLPPLSLLQKLVRKNISRRRGIPYQVGNSLVICRCENEVAERVMQLPTIPCLVELSRNATRRHIIKRFGVKNSRQFYTVIQCLPISATHKEIVSLERMLY